MNDWRQLTLVSAAFSLTGRGTVLVLEMPESDDWRLTNGQAVPVRPPHGESVRLNIVAIEFVDPAGSLALVVGSAMKPEDAPIGTQVWIEA